MNTAELRLLWQDETALRRLTQSAPPTTHNLIEQRKRDGSTWWEDRLEEEPADRVGQSMSGQMVSLVGGVSDGIASYSPRWPVRRALQEWERQCRRRHRPLPSSQWRDHTQGPLCSDLLRAASLGVSLRWCSETWGVPYPRAERLLQAGLRFVNERLTRWQDDQLGLVHDRDRCEQCREEDQGA